MTPKEIAASLAADLYGIDYSENMAKGLCIQCKLPAAPRCYSEAGQKEFTISGLCEICFDELFEE